MIIRPMENDDLPQVAAIEEQLFSDPWSVEDFRASLLQPAARFLVAEDEKAGILGYCGSYRAMDESEIVNVAVRPDCQNRGVGRLMVARLREEERQAGARRFILEVRMSNRPARHVYEKLGFEITGIRKGFYENPPEDALVMMLEDITTDE